jgi:hypothetical protein
MRFSDGQPPCGYGETVQRAVAMLVLAGASLGLTAGTVAAAPTAVVPVPGSAACKVRPPQLLRAGRAPLAPLRLDLAGIAHHRQTVVETETFARRLRLLDGVWHPTTEIRKIEERARAGSIAGGNVAISARNTVSFPGTRTSARAKGGSFTLSGRTDRLSGGFLGGSAGNDRFPVEPVGVGAVWRIVTCDPIDATAAQELRTYTVRSVAHGLVVLTFRDIVSMDPAQRDLGTQKIGAETVKLRLDQLRGTASGTYRIPLANALRSSSTTVTKVELSFHVISQNVPATPLVTRLVDTRTVRPTG